MMSQTVYTNTLLSVRRIGVDQRGIEPRPFGCKPNVLPLSLKAQVAVCRSTANGLESWCSGSLLLEGLLLNSGLAREHRCFLLS